jgi:mono/diheme cytochrome c family protein
MKTVFWTVVVLVVVVLVGGYAFIRSGAYDVAATSPPSAVERWLANAVRDRSVEVRAHGVAMPDLSDPALIRRGYRSYDHMCVGCHSAPGLQESPVERGLNPRPPHLWSHGTQEIPDQQLFWIVKHGFRMTGMPGFGPTHDDQQIWSLVAVIRQLATLQPGQYEAAVRQAEAEVPPPAVATPIPSGSPASP